MSPETGALEPTEKKPRKKRAASRYQVMQEMDKDKDLWSFHPESFPSEKRARTCIAGLPVAPEEGVVKLAVIRICGTYQIEAKTVTVVRPAKE